MLQLFPSPWHAHKKVAFLTHRHKKETRELNIASHLPPVPLSQFTTLDTPAPRRCLVLHPRDNTTVSRVKGSQGDRHNVKFQRYRRSAHILLPSLLWKVSPDLNSTAKLSACFNFRIFFFPRCLFDCLSVYLCIFSFTGRLFPDDTDRHRDSGKHFK